MTKFVTDTFNWLSVNTVTRVVDLGRLLVGSEIPAVKEVAKALSQHTVANISMFIRIAGISGALAVGLGAYGAHVFRDSDADERLKLTFQTGNRYHFFHTIALLATPLTRRPKLVGSLMSLGMLLFCGSCYTNALTGNVQVRQVTPYGGLLLIAAWAAMAI